MAIAALELWCWKRLLRVPWTAGRSNQSILKVVSPKYSFESFSWGWNSNSVATWCKRLTRLKRPWCWERLKVGGEGDDRGWDGWMALLTQWTWVWVNSGSWWWTGRPGVLQSMESQRVRHDWVTELFTVIDFYNRDLKDESTPISKASRYFSKFNITWVTSSSFYRDRFNMDKIFKYHGC